MEGQEGEMYLRKSKWFDYYIDKNEIFNFCILIRKWKMLITIPTGTYGTFPGAKYRTKITIQGTTVCS